MFKRFWELRELRGLGGVRVQGLGLEFRGLGSLRALVRGFRAFRGLGGLGGVRV